jgi:hypothetical protein
MRFVSLTVERRDRQTDLAAALIESVFLVVLADAGDS